MSTQEKAKKILIKKGLIELTNKQKTNLMIAFARKGKTIHRRAFDFIRVKKKINFSDENDIFKNLDSITLIEMKATDRPLDKNFSGYYFGITLREHILAQSLKKQYKFLFVNVNTEHILELDLPQVQSKIKHFDLVLHTRF